MFFCAKKLKALSLAAKYAVTAGKTISTTYRKILTKTPQWYYTIKVHGSQFIPLNQKLSRPRQTHIQYRLPGSLILGGLHPGQCAFRFLLPAEHILHVHAGFLHHFEFEVRADVCHGLLLADYALVVPP